MKKRAHFLCLCAVLLLVLAGSITEFAKADENSKILYNQAGLTLLSEKKFEKGESYTAPNGKKVPAVITYVDSSGEKTNYLSVRQISELLGLDIAWNSEEESIDIAPRQELSVDDIQVGDAGENREPTTIPKYGEKVGPFTEINPNQVNTDQDFVVATATVHTISTAGTNGLEVPCFSEDANYIVYTVTNNGNNSQLISVQQKSIMGKTNAFTTVLLPAGKTLQRAFYLEEGAEDAQSILEFSAIGYMNLETDITESVKTYP